MFYDIRVMNSKRMGAVWRAANDLENDTSDVDLLKVCSHICKWTDGYEDNCRRHLSLRASSLLVNGAVRVLKEQLQSLYDDCVQLTEDVLQRRLETNSNVNGSSNDSTSTNSKTSSNSNKFSAHKRRRTSENWPSSSNTVDESQNVTSRTYVIECDENNPNSRSLYKIDKEIQTTKSHIGNKKLREGQKKEKQNNDKTTQKPPMGVVMVYGSESRVPTKIICSKIKINILPQ